MKRVLIATFVCSIVSLLYSCGHCGCSNEIIGVIKKDQKGVITKLDFSLVKTQGNLHIFPTGLRSRSNQVSRFGLSFAEIKQVDSMLASFQKEKGVIFNQVSYFSVDDNSYDDQLYISAISQPIDTTAEMLVQENAHLLAVNNELKNDLKKVNGTVTSIAATLKTIKAALR